MGLAPSCMDEIRQIVRLQSGYEFNVEYFPHHREAISYRWTSGSPEFGDLFLPALEKLLGPSRRPKDPLLDWHRDIARSVQAMYEEAF